VPRRALILSLISLASFTFLLDGFAFVAYAVVNKVWPQNTGIEINAIIGIIAYSGLACLGTWKDVHGVPVWSLNRVKVVVAFALLLDIAHVVLLGFATKFHKGCECRRDVTKWTGIE
jgi:ATP-binding cassette subfamily B (MDR/TAP) protein 6